MGKTRAFCAGGELSEVVSEDGIALFIGPEYQLDYYISRYPKPQIAIWNGIVMGAGYGLTGHADIRVATEHFQFAMPESRFGLIADVGCAHLLTKQCPEYLGRYLTLTADRIRGTEAVWSGVSTDFVSSSQLASLYNALLQAVSEFFAHSNPTTSQGSSLLLLLRTIVRAESTEPEKSHHHLPRLQRLYPHIKSVFGLKSLADIYTELKNISTSEKAMDQEQTDWIKFCLNAFNIDCCPFSSTANFTMMLKAAEKSFSYSDSLINDYRAAIRIALREDIRLGAMGILFKTGPPKWSPSSIFDVSQEEIARLFYSLQAFPTEAVCADLDLPGPYLC